MKRILTFVLTISILVLWSSCRKDFEFEPSTGNLQFSKDTVYLDTLNKRTVGYGHLCVEDHWEDGKKYDKEYLEEVLEKDLQSAIDQADDMCSNLTISDDAKIIIIEMIFQLGGTGVSKFRKMWAALQEDPPNYFEAHVQMLDSRWAKQTPNRASEMAEQMQNCE